MKNKIYQVNVKEVHSQPFLVRAKNRKEARQKVADGDGVIIEEWFEYSYSLEPKEMLDLQKDVLSLLTDQNVGFLVNDSQLEGEAEEFGGLVTIGRAFKEVSKVFDKFMQQYD